MIKDLERLSDSELESMLKAPLLVCILIAGADNEIDKKELRGAIELAKSAKAKPNLVEFYIMAVEDFEDKLKIILQGLPSATTKRNPILFEELAHLNPILRKIGKSFAADYYQSLLYIARRIAESSGGVLGLKSVGDEESKLIQLPMIKDPSLN